MDVTSATGYGRSADIVHITRNCQVAGSVVVLYDHVLSFSREVDYIWHHPLSFGSINYILVRYIGDALAILNIIAFVGQGVLTRQLCVTFCSLLGLIHGCGEIMTIYSCKVYFFAQSWPSTFVLFLIQLMLQARLYALYKRSRVILAFMVFGYMCEIAAMCAIIGIVDVNALVSNKLAANLYICANERGPSYYHSYVFWLPVIVYDSILCALALWHGISKWLSGHRPHQVHGVRVADALIKGNANYFFCILLACLVSVVTEQVLGIQWTEVYEGYPAAVESVIGCRLILDLRSSLMRDVRDDDWDDDASWSPSPAATLVS